MSEIIKQRFIGDNGLHAHYVISEFYDSFYISNGDNLVYLDYDNVEDLVKVLADYCKDIENRDNGKESQQEEKEVLPI